jgi:hypothetical protein
VQLQRVVVLLSALLPLAEPQDVPVPERRQFLLVAPAPAPQNLLTVDFGDGDALRVDAF